MARLDQRSAPGDAKDDVAIGFCQRLGFLRFVNRVMTLYLPIAEAARRLALHGA